MPIKPARHARVKSLKFTVDAALFRELGERLVGKPHIALGELVKNSYDADATQVTIRFESDRIVVSDDGNGMSLPQFRDFWMRVGSPHKQTERVSPVFARPVTGSKGVGRLAVQFLARAIVLRTSARETPSHELQASVDWEKAVTAGDLTSARATYVARTRSVPYASDRPHGTEIVLIGLRHTWTPGDLARLAREIWYLQPPFRPNPRLTTEEQRSFLVRVESGDAEQVQAFASQMRVALDSWEARLVGRLRREQKGGSADGLVDLVLEFSGGTRETHSYVVSDCVLFDTDFEIRVYRHSRRQPHGVKVADARDYFSDFGGVHVYDGGFHLPYYGVDNDWLDIERDHSHRLSASQLLPKEMNVKRGMNFLPTQTRLFGVVHVDTAREAHLADKEGGVAKREHLRIQVSRDRLVDNEALQNLRKAVRYALDYYAVRAALRAAGERSAQRAVEPVSDTLEHLEEVIAEHEEEIPARIAIALRHGLRRVAAAAEAETETLASHAGLLGALATAGVTALAFEHEISKRMTALSEIAAQLAEMATQGRRASSEELKTLAHEIHDWVEQAESTRSVFSPLLSQEDRELRVRLRALPVVEAVAKQIRVLLRGTKVDVAGIVPALRLPKGTLAEWSAILQNVFVNAVNAMLDSDQRVIRVRSESHARTRAIIVEDTGAGIDLTRAESLFEPFARGLTISSDRRELGYGGTGLGLPIVRMIASSLRCRVAFVEPADGFRTAFRLSWTETT